jgi:uncharacterized protein (DUF1501 family)
VINPILLDPEARTRPAGPADGKLRKPIVRLVASTGMTTWPNGTVLLGNLGSALASFHDTTAERGVADQVATFTASEFGRTLSSKGDGSDHGWGGHHAVLGGAVNGGRCLGQAPEVSINGIDDVGQGRLLPTTAVDHLAATLATWMGVSDTDLAILLPQIGNYSTRNLGFMAA